MKNICMRCGKLLKPDGIAHTCTPKKSTVDRFMLEQAVILCDPSADMENLVLDLKDHNGSIEGAIEIIKSISTVYSLRADRAFNILEALIKEGKLS